ncbi:MAG TPA: TIM barrel protein [Puia sp.]|nr:TIM barrel protein [Puia sp.]
MNKLNRRKFLGQASMGLGSALLLSRLSLNAARASGRAGKHTLGFQTFPIRDALSKDFPGTLKMMADMGYQTVEMCSPSGYAGIGFGKFATMKGGEIKKVINDAGLSCPSCHFTFPELQNKLDDRIEFAQQLGLNYMICSTFWLPKTATIKTYQESADAMNKIAEKISKAGMQAGFHNHEFEFASIDGVLIYDALMSEFDPKLVKMQFQTEVINLGYKAADYFKKYPGRFISAHMSDWTPEKKEVPIGKGVIDWKEFYAAAEIGGVKTFLVEMNMDTFKDSAAYIKELKEA